MKETLSSSETSVITRATRRNIPEDTILHISHKPHTRDTRPAYQFPLSDRGNKVSSSYDALWVTVDM
jgi:hypothetical protein